ncbi:MAG TPA: CotH kinase family protein, partial [Chitinophagaceae bacterium]|nr:CotH kinase family protein [Chitinophagaceae bacterium]
NISISLMFLIFKCIEFNMIREVLAYQILKNYMHCPLSNFAQVYVNGNYFGLYSSAENIDKNFCADHFYTSNNTFIKCNPTIIPGPTTKSNFKFINSDSSSYASYYEIKSKSGWNELVNLCDTITNQSASIENIVDMDRAIWMLAFNNLLINLDSYNGVFAQNHYIYKDNTSHYNPIIWDLNMSFGGFPFAGAGGTSMGSLNISGMQQFPIDNHASDTFWPLINVVQNTPSFKKKYIAHMKTILSEYFSSSLYETLAIQLKTQIDTAVQSDINKFFSYTQFTNSLDSLTDVGSYDVPGIKTLMEARKSYLLSLPEFMAAPPTISSITPNNASPTFNSSLTINANISNSSNVILGYRFNQTEKFTKISMYDDGAHNDGGANDNNFGATITVIGGELQYYIYTENTNAGIFSPARAEHEFYTLNTASQVPTSGQLVINEILCDNVDNQRDEYNDTEDWIELYNTSNQLLNLSDIYLSDKVSNLQKWKFPTNTTINPNAYLTIWADDDSLEQIFHTNFNLSKDTGILILSNAAGQILDSISFTNQAPNISYGRYPNGTGNFMPMNTSFGYINNNYPLSISNVLNKESFVLYPNPCSDYLTLDFEGKQPISIFNLQGQIVYHNQSNNHVQINTSKWMNGIYFIKCGHTISKLIVHHS